MKDEKNQNSKFENRTKTETEEYQTHAVKSLNNPDCDHIYEDQGLDPEGRMWAVCIRCPMGRLYDSKEYKLVKGNIVGNNK